MLAVSSTKTVTSLVAVYAEGALVGGRIVPEIVVGGGKLEEGGLASASCSLGGAVGSCPGAGAGLM